jgi:2-polyprenyl-3-methyl-5-hydroxy-6-metoxy-1,4-benzoquinol methylase
MKEATAENAVGYFSDNVSQFQDLYRDSPGFQERVELWEKLLQRYQTPKGRALDLGCGAGVFSFRLAELGNQVVGVDGAPNMVASCEARRQERGLQNLRFMQGTLPRIDETGLAGADLVISSSVIEYVEELDETLALFARLLRPGGYLIVSMPNVQSISRTYQRLMHRVRPRGDVYRYIKHFSSPRALSRRAKRLGLVPRESHYYTCITKLARIGRSLHLPRLLTEDLFVVVFQKQP